MNRKKVNMFDRFLYENLLKEDYTITEAVKIAKDIVNVLHKYGYDIPTESDIQLIEPSPQENMLDIIKVDKQGRERKQSIKITKLLKALYPSIDLVGDTEVQKLVSELRLVTGQKKERYTFEIYDDVAYWYKKLKTEYSVGSCVVDNGRIESGETDKVLRGLNQLKDLQIVVVFDTETKSYVGRALLWHNVTGVSKSLLDRTYPSTSEPMHTILTRWAEQQGFDYRSSMSHDGYHSISGNRKQIKFNCGKLIDEDIVSLPYMDTFRWCTTHPKTGKVWFMNYKPASKTATSWILNSPSGVTIYTKPTCDVCGKALKRTSEIHRTEQHGRICDECFQDFNPCGWCRRTYKTNGKTDELMRHDNMTYLSKHEKFICRNCASNEFKQCAKCGKYDFNNEYREFINKNGQTQYICGTCVDKHGVKTCSECNAFTENIKEVIVDGDTHYVCNKCGDKFIQCRECSKYFYGDDLWYSKVYLFTNCFCDPCFQKLSKKYKTSFSEEAFKEHITNGFTIFDDLDEDDKNTIRKKSVIKEGTSKHYNDLYTTILTEMDGYKSF